MTEKVETTQPCGGCGGTGRDDYVDRDWLKLTGHTRWLQRPHAVCNGTGRIPKGYR